MEKNENPYIVLGVEKDATEAQIKSTYRKLALKHHPDRQKTEEEKAVANAVFAKVSAAYDMLTDPVKKRDFDLANRDWDKHRRPAAAASAAPTAAPPAPASASAPPPASKPTGAAAAASSHPSSTSSSSSSKNNSNSHQNTFSHTAKPQKWTKTPPPATDETSSSTSSSSLSSSTGGGSQSQKAKTTYAYVNSRGTADKATSNVPPSRGRKRSESPKPKTTYAYSGGNAGDRTTANIPPRSRTESPKPDTTYAYSNVDGAGARHSAPRNTRPESPRPKTAYAYAGSDGAKATANVPASNRTRTESPKPSTAYAYSGGGDRSTANVPAPKSPSKPQPDTTYSYAAPDTQKKSKPSSFSGRTTKRQSARKHSFPESWSDSDGDDSHHGQQRQGSSTTAPAVPSTAYGFSNLRDPGFNIPRRKSSDPLGGSTHSTRSYRRQPTDYDTDQESVSGSIKSTRSYLNTSSHKGSDAKKKTKPKRSQSLDRNSKTKKIGKKRFKKKASVVSDDDSHANGANNTNGATSIKAHKEGKKKKKTSKKSSSSAATHNGAAAHTGSDNSAPLDANESDDMYGKFHSTKTFANSKKKKSTKKTKKDKLPSAAAAAAAAVPPAAAAAGSSYLPNNYSETKLNVERTSPMRALSAHARMSMPMSFKHAPPLHSASAHQSSRVKGHHSSMSPGRLRNKVQSNGSSAVTPPSVSNPAASPGRFKNRPGSSPGRLRNKVQVNGKGAVPLPPPPMSNAPASPGKFKSRRSSAAPTAPQSPGKFKNSRRLAAATKKSKQVAQFHDPFEMYNRIMKDEFGIVDNGKKGMTKLPKGPTSTKPQPLSVSTKSKVMEHPDGRVEYKTVTKVERPDGTTDRFVQSSVAEPHETIERLPRNASASYVNPKRRKSL